MPVLREAGAPRRRPSRITACIAKGRAHIPSHRRPTQRSGGRRGVAPDSGSEARSEAERPSFHWSGGRRRILRHRHRLGIPCRAVPKNVTPLTADNISSPLPPVAATHIHRRSKSQGWRHSNDKWRMRTYTHPFSSPASPTVGLGPSSHRLEPSRPPASPIVRFPGPGTSPLPPIRYVLDGLDTGPTRPTRPGRLNHSGRPPQHPLPGSSQGSLRM